MSQVYTLDGFVKEKGTIPKSDTGVVIQLPMEEGYGDLVAGYKIGQRLGEEDYIVFFSFENKETICKFTHLTGGRKNTNFNWNYYNKDIISSFKKSILINPYVNHFSTKETPLPKDNFDLSIALEEYDLVDRLKYDGTRFDFYIWTGIGFDKKERNAIQSGLYLPKSFSELTDMIGHEEKHNQKKAVLKNTPFYNRLLSSSHTNILERILRSEWSLAYASVYGLSTDLFFDILQAARKNNNEFSEKEITVFLFGKGNGKSNEGLRERIRDYQFNHFSPNDGREYTYSDSPVTVVNIDHTIHKHFTALTSLTDLPSLVIGDHSVTRMIQAKKPFFYEVAEWKTEFAENLALRLGGMNVKTQSQFLREQDPKEDLDGLMDRYEEILYPELSRLFHSGDISPHLFLTYSLPGYGGYVNYDANVLSQLFYDKDTQDRFRENLAKIPERIRKLKEPHIKRADLLVNVLDTVSYVVNQSRNGVSVQEIKGDLLPS